MSEAEMIHEAEPNTRSINDIFPKEIIQYILSFGDIWSDLSTKCVNKEWKELSDAFERKQYLQILESLDQNSPIPYDKKKNNTWLVHAEELKDLTALERNMGFKMADFFNVDILEHGDRLLVHSGLYQLIPTLEIEKDLSIVGMGNNYPICLYDGRDDEGALLVVGTDQSTAPVRVYIENITFECNSTDRDEVINVQTNSTLILNKCKLDFVKSAITVNIGSSLKVESCVFDGGQSAIEISPIAKDVTVKNSVFKHCGHADEFAYSWEHACIQVINLDTVHDLRNKLIEGVKMVKLECVGNVFQDNLCFPIAERAEIEYDEQGFDYFLSPAERPIYIGNHELYNLENNVLRGYNATSVTQQKNIADANKIYFNDEEFQWDPYTGGFYWE